MNTKATIVVSIKQGSSYPYCIPATKANGKLKPGWVLIDGIPVEHREGVYHVRWYEGRKLHFEKVSKEADEAEMARVRRKRILAARASGVVIQEVKTDRRLLADVIKEYLIRVQIQRSKKTQNEFDLMLPEFQFVTGLTYPDQVSGESLLQYAHHLRVKGNSARTVANRVGRIQCFLRHHGIDKLLKPHEKPKFDKRIAEAYSEEELACLFKAAPPGSACCSSSSRSLAVARLK